MIDVERSHRELESTKVVLAKDILRDKGVRVLSLAMIKHGGTKMSNGIFFGILFINKNNERSLIFLQTNINPTLINCLNFSIPWNAFNVFQTFAFSLKRFSRERFGFLFFLSPSFFFDFNFIFQLCVASPVLFRNSEQRINVFA